MRQHNEGSRCCAAIQFPASPCSQQVHERLACAKACAMTARLQTRAPLLKQNMMRTSNAAQFTSVAGGARPRDIGRAAGAHSVALRARLELQQLWCLRYRALSLHDGFFELRGADHLLQRLAQALQRRLFLQPQRDPRLSVRNAFSVLWVCLRIAPVAAPRDEPAGDCALNDTAAGTAGGKRACFLTGSAQAVAGTMAVMLAPWHTLHYLHQDKKVCVNPETAPAHNDAVEQHLYNRPGCVAASSHVIAGISSMRVK